MKDVVKRLQNQLKITPVLDKLLAETPENQHDTSPETIYYPMVSNIGLYRYRATE